jgi:hypothetical protein
MRPNPHITSITTLTLAIAMATAAAGATLGGHRNARPVALANLEAPVVSLRAHTLDRSPRQQGVEPGSGEWATATRPGAARSGLDLTDASGHGQPIVAPVIVRVTTPQAGFDWGDAGIGAAAALGISMIALAAALAITQWRPRRTPQPPGGMR